MSRALSPTRALVRLGFRQTLRGAIILGIVAGGIMIIQAIGYAATYPTEHDRQLFAQTLGAAPSLGILYGEPAGLLTASGYMVYRGVTVMALVTAIWGLLATTRILRGNEEDGRWEVLQSGATTNRRTTVALMMGLFLSLVVSFSLSTLITILGGLSPDVAVGVGTSLLINFSLFAPTIVFIALGGVLSQLWRSRRRALTIGLTIIGVCYALRSTGNILTDWYWLKNFTPFGWTDRIAPIVDPQPAWFLLFLAMFALMASAAVYLAGKRDIDTGILPDSDQQKPHYFLLGSPLQLSLRRSIGSTIGWTIGVVAIGVLVASVSSLAAESIAESPQLGETIARLSGGSVDKLKLAFIGSGILFTSLILLIMTAVGIGDIRRNEAKQFADTVLVQPATRTRWLLSQLSVVFATIVFVSLMTGVAIWLVAQSQQLDISLATMLGGSLQNLGAIIFALGVGACIYGLWPRLASVSIYLILGWSFFVEFVGSVYVFDELIMKSTLFRYISLVPAVEPDWQAFTWLTGIGVVLIAAGCVAFKHRDIVTE